MVNGDAYHKRYSKHYNRITYQIKKIKEKIDKYNFMKLNSLKLDMFSRELLTELFEFDQMESDEQKCIDTFKVIRENMICIESTIKDRKVIDDIINMYDDILLLKASRTFVKDMVKDELNNK